MAGAMVIVWILSLVMSFGFIGYLGIKFTSSNVSLSYMAAILVILYSTFMLRSVENIKITTQEANLARGFYYHDKFAAGFAYAASSLAKTYLVTVLTFGVGSITTIPAIQSFCAVGACLVTFMFVQICFIFAPALFYDTKRIILNKTDCCGACCCAASSSIFCCGRCVLDKYEERKESFSDVFINEKLVPMLVNNWIRALFIIIYAGICVVGVIGVLYVPQEFDVDWLIKSDSDYVKDAKDVRDDYFSDRGTMVGLYMTDANFSNEGNQKDVENLYEHFRGCKDCDETWIYEDTVFSYHNSFKEWVNQGNCYFAQESYYVELNSDDVIPSFNYDYCLKEWIQTAPAQFFINDLIFDDDDTLKAARIWGRAKYIDE